MGKKSQIKKGRKKWIRITPDEVFSYGTLRIERCGRHVLFSNTSTSEGHAVFLERAKKANKEILEDLEKEVAVLQNLVNKYDPVELMHRATYMLLPLFIKYKSENEFTAEEVYYLPTVEYLQFLIARTIINADGEKPSETEWDEMWKQAIQVLKLTQSHLIFRET